MVARETGGHQEATRSLVVTERWSLGGGWSLGSHWEMDGHRVARRRRERWGCWTGGSIPATGLGSFAEHLGGFAAANTSTPLVLFPILANEVASVC